MSFGPKKAVSWVPKKKMGSLFVGGFTAPSGTSSTYKKEKSIFFKILQTLVHWSEFIVKHPKWI